MIVFGKVTSNSVIRKGKKKVDKMVEKVGKKIHKCTFSVLLTLV